MSLKMYENVYKGPCPNFFIYPETGMPVSCPDPLPPPPPRNGRPSIEWHGVVSCICTVQWRSLFKLIGMFNVMRLWTVPLHPSFFTLSFGHGSLCGQLAFGASGGSACSRRPGHTLCHWRRSQYMYRACKMTRMRRRRGRTHGPSAPQH